MSLGAPIHFKGEIIMKRVIVEVRKGKAYVVHCPKNVEVIVKQQKKLPWHKAIRKLYRKALYQIKRVLRLV
jgi:hypothetical protein